MSCGELRSRLAAYWLGELAEPEEQALEEHLFDCDDCSAASEGVGDLIAALQQRIPATLTAPAIARLERLGTRMRHTKLSPGARVTVVFDRDIDFLVHHLQHDLTGLKEDERVDVEAANAADGTLLLTIPDLDFERESGEVNVVCLRHYVELFPPDGELRLVAVGPEGRRRLASYNVMHILPT